MGLLELMGAPSGWLQENRGAVTGLGRGVMGARSWQEALQGGLAGAQGGVPQDTAYDKLQREEQMRQEQVAQAEQRKNATVEWLQNAGYGDLAQLAASGMAEEAFNTAVARQRAAQQGGDPATYYGTAVPFQRPDGSIGYGQLGNDGSFKEIGFPSGTTPLSPVQQLNTGTGFTGVDKFGNQTGGVVPIDNFGAAAATASGKLTGEATTNAALSLPNDLAKADQAVSLIDSIASDPNLNWAIGGASMLPTVPGTPQAGLVAKVDQLKGQAFLEAFESLKGGGAITEREGQAATQAIARLDRAQNETDFKRALADLRAVIVAASERAKEKAGRSTPGDAPAANDPFGLRF